MSLSFGLRVVPVVILMVIHSSGTDIDSAHEARLTYFEKSVRPLLADKCYACHSAETKPSGGLRVDDRNGLLAGGDRGPAVVPGNPEKSLLIARIRHADPKQIMPRDSEPLTGEQIAVLEQWIRDGAVWPQEALPENLLREPGDYAALRAGHWAWQPLASAAVPEVKDGAWPRSDVDRFILAAMEKAGLQPVEDAGREALIRRVTFDLTGLPPSPEEVALFLADSAADSFERLVDRLLASPAFAEQWARHWLDVARYGESTGPSRNIPYPHAWRYRDYVIAAIQNDVPVNRFITEQIAGDLLLAASPAERDRLFTATGFLAIGPRDVNQRFRNRFLMDNADEQIDVVTRSVLGLTVSCARCHDHKFDPVPMKDYYALAGIFTSTEDCTGVRNKMGGGGLDYYDPAKLLHLSGDVPPPPQAEVERLKAEVAEAKKAWDAIRGTPEGLKRGPDGKPVQRPFRLRFEKLQSDLLALTDPAARGFAVHGARDAKVIADTEIRIRGEAERTGPAVPRGFPSVPPISSPPAVPASESGRRQLAEWLTHPQNALTQRVFVNRVWTHLFGKGIVSTPDNFGIKGAPPSHPELLDHLAAQFAADGWSLKKLVRQLVLTRTWQLAGTPDPESQRADPDNRLLWRHSPRRLSAEEFRDAVLATGGRLEPRPAESVSRELKMVEMRDNGPEAKKLHEHAADARYRSLYLPLLRTVVPGVLEPFDPAPQSLVTGKRDETTVPAQVLFLLNSAFIRREALALAEKASAIPYDEAGEQVRDLYQRAFGRPPTASETARALRFLTEFAPGGPVPAESAPALAAAAPPPATDPPATGVAANPDDIDRTDFTPAAVTVTASDPRTAAWLALVQAVFASAEFRFVP